MRFPWLSSIYKLNGFSFSLNVDLMNDPKTISATVCLQKWLPVVDQLSYMSFCPGEYGGRAAFQFPPDG